MFTVGVVVGGKQNWHHRLAASGSYRLKLIESEPAKRKTLLVPEHLLQTPVKSGEPIDLVHLCLAGMSERQMLQQLRFAGQQPNLLTNLTILLCEVDPAGGASYQFVCSYLQGKCAYRLHIDYFLVLAITHPTAEGGVHIYLQSGHDIINQTVEAYYKNVLTIKTSLLRIESAVV